MLNVPAAYAVGRHRTPSQWLYYYYLAPCRELSEMRDSLSRVETGAPVRGLAPCPLCIHMQMLSRLLPTSQVPLKSAGPRISTKLPASPTTSLVHKYYSCLNACCNFDSTTHAKSTKSAQYTWKPQNFRLFSHLTIVIPMYKRQHPPLPSRMSDLLAPEV